MKTKVVRVGNSRAVILPAPVADARGLKVGDELELEEIPSGVLVRPAARRSVRTATKRVLRDHATIMRELAKR